MKTTFKQFIFLFFAIVITGCGKDDEREEIPMISVSDSEYQNYIYNNLYDVECLSYQEKGANNIKNVDFSGLKNNHLYLRSVQFDMLYRNDYSKWKTVIEWEDTETTTKEQKRYLGYGNYETFFIEKVHPYVLSVGSNGFSSALMLFNGSNSGKILLVFKNLDLIKRVSVDNIYLNALAWYQGGILTWLYSSLGVANNFCCYSAKGDTIYTSNTPNSFPDANAIPISYEESISVNNYDLTITKYNWKEGKQTWSVKVVSPYNEPSNSKYTLTLLDKSTNIWKYKVDIVYYDGTKKDFMFTVNVNDGKVINL